MSIQGILEQSIKNLQAEEEREIAVIRERVTQEKIIPYNKEMDEARDKAISELQNDLTASIQALQNKFAEDKQKIIEANEKKKAENATATVATETYSIQMRYERAIARLSNQLESQK